MSYPAPTPPAAPAPGPPGSAAQAELAAALARLAEVEQRPPAEQLAAYEAAHQALARTLATIDLT